MKQFDKPDINPPAETTAEEAERDKRRMGETKAAAGAAFTERTANEAPEGKPKK